MKDDAELRAAIERVRRSTRNADVLDICDALLAKIGHPLADDAKTIRRREQAKLRMRRMRANGKRGTSHGLP